MACTQLERKAGACSIYRPRHKAPMECGQGALPVQAVLRMLCHMLSILHAHAQVV